MKNRIEIIGGHSSRTTISPVRAWMSRNKGLIKVYTIGIAVILLQLRSIL